MIVTREQRRLYRIATILYESMLTGNDIEVARKHKIPYETMQKWEDKYSTLWVLKTLSEGKEFFGGTQ